MYKKLSRGMTKHGMCKTKFYIAYHGMYQRCNNPTCKRYYRYGGRGIKNLWKSFEEFRDDMYGDYLKHIEKFGEKNTTLDRIDNNGNYCKENCHWATWEQQRDNKPNPVRNGEGEKMRQKFLSDKKLLDKYQSRKRYVGRVAEYYLEQTSGND